MLPNRSLNPHQSVSRINGCIKPELTTSFPLCIWPLCFIISSSTKGFLYMSPCMHLTNQTPTMVLVGQGLRAAQVHYSLVCTPLAPYWNIVYLSWTRGKCWEIGNKEHLSSLHQWTLPVKMHQSPTRSTLLPRHLCNPRWVGWSIHSCWNPGRERRKKWEGAEKVRRELRSFLFRAGTGYPNWLKVLGPPVTLPDGPWSV